MAEVETKVDFIQWLGRDLSTKVFTHLDDPRDLVRVSAVSSSWYRFVIENGLCKQLYLKLYPELSRIVHTVEVDNMIEPISNVLGSSINWECLKRNHKVYALLAVGLTPMRNNYISKTICGSWTNYYQDESVQNPLVGPRDEIKNWASYLPSIVGDHPSVLVIDTLMYLLCSKICLVTEIHVRQSRAYIDEFPINFTKALRIRMGHSRYPKLVDMPIAGLCLEPDVVENRFIWTYTSPVFSISRENQWHEYKLAEPVLCIGGILQMEECGRFGIPGVNASFFGRICDVQLVGWSLSPLIDVKMQHPSGKCTLKYCPKQIVVCHQCHHREETRQSFIGGESFCLFGCHVLRTYSREFD